MRPLLILDGDDTLWETERLYDEARQSVRVIVESYGLDGERWEQTERRIDVERAATLGFSPERFPGSCQLAYEAIAGSAWRNDRSLHVYRAASSPFERVAELYPDTQEFVRQARTEVAAMVLLTKGERQVQWRRVSDSGLAGYFDAVVIVQNKSVNAFVALRQAFGCDIPAISIGNSWRSDIEPALDAGCGAIWIDRHVWEHERVDPKIVSEPPTGVFVAGSLSEARQFI